MRLSGAALENSQSWAKLNLFWGGLFPSLGSEVYLQARKDEVHNNEISPGGAEGK
jgi:hypothetical protein